MRIARTVALAAAALLALAGCRTNPTAAAGNVVAAQAPGVATGAGATLTGPTNSDGPSTQTSLRRIGYYPPQPTWPLPQTGINPTAPIASAPAQATAAPSYPVAPAPAWIEERAETTLAPHQDATAIMKAAGAMNRWNKVQWLGLFCIVAGIAGLLWSAGHDQGYPLVLWKVTGIGLFLCVFCENPYWALLLIFPAGFYAVQKFNLVRFPT